MLLQSVMSSVGQAAAEAGKALRPEPAPLADDVKLLTTADRPDGGQGRDKELTESADTISRDLSYAIGGFYIGFFKDEKTEKMVIRIIDRESGEVRKQIPPDQILALMYRLRELQGLVVDQKA